ncbi:MAG: hypothetical protein OEZ39_12965 [Gammaproteobacteria bacterium]|nr:hypothetical protein [Gammaproteobacteria bacterium]MDH5652759.1 hypothetical protein [Gammaproteobacteria bacterium]
MKNITCAIFLMFLITGCSTTTKVQEFELLAKKPFTLAEIEFRKQGVGPENRPYMKEACRGFSLSESQVKTFFASAEIVAEADLAANSTILPCHSVGTVNINDIKYSWVIRAGGIGEFYNDKDKFYKVCGKECCEKNPGLC